MLNQHIFGVPGGGGGTSYVIWAGKTGVTETALSTLVYDSMPGPGWGLHGAYSVQSVASGDIKIEALATEPSPVGLHILGMIGISNVTDAQADANYTSIDYAIFGFINNLYAVESGAVTSLGLSYANDDVLSVEVASGQVLYKQNGSIIRTVSSPTLNYPLCVDLAMESDGEWRNCQVTI